MADNENTITVVGRIGQEPELRATPKGDVCSFSVATTERRRGPDGTWSDGTTSWFRVAAWDDLGRHAHASLRRGQQVIVRGVLTISEFQTQSGDRAKKVELRATALGHDLRWGTTTYADQRGTDQRQTAQAAPAGPASPIAQQEQPAAELETVPARGGDWGAAYPDDAPF